MAFIGGKGKGKNNHNYKHGRMNTLVYNSWESMKGRCSCKKSPYYKNYGGRGIKVCKRWMKFKNFLEDMGDRKKGMSLDRIDNNKGYFKENCRWATRKQQQNNRTNNHKVTFDGKTKTISEWSEVTGISKVTLRQRLVNGWDVEKSLFNKVKIFHKRVVEYNGVTRPLSEWAKEYGIKQTTLYNRLYCSGWPIYKALNEKIKN